MINIKATTFEAFVEEVQAKQCGYIAEQRAAMAALRRARDITLTHRAYKVTAFLLGFHPLTLEEIQAREAELDRMEREVPATHGDTAVMRWSFENHLARLREAGEVPA